MGGSYFRDARNVESSIAYYLQTQLDTDWTGITTTKTFSRVYSNSVNIPIVCVRLADTNSTRLEVGANTLDFRFTVIIDIFAKSDAQRLDLADYVTDKLKDGCVFNEYSHASGDNSQVVPTPNGRIMVTNWINNMKVELGDNVDKKDRFRHVISIQVRRSTLS